MHFSAKLAFMFPNESRYLNNTLKVWDWFFSFDNGYGLMSDEYLVSTGAIPEKCCNSTSTSEAQNRCQNTRLPGMMSTCAYLYIQTGNIIYHKTGLRLLDAIIANYTTKDGILVDEPRSYQSFEGACWGNADPGGDWYSFNGIFMLHLGYFTDLLWQNKSLEVKDIRNLINKTSEAAWNRSAQWPPFDSTDGCNIGVDPVDSKAN